MPKASYSPVAAATIALLLMAGCTLAESVPGEGADGGQADGAAVPLVPLVRIGESVRIGSVSIVPAELLEDSRCPEGVQCAWPGQVRLRAQIRHDGANAEHVLVNGQPLALGGLVVTLSHVEPRRTRANMDQLRSADAVLANYRFGFTVTAPGAGQQR